jgi:uncharacterized membrane protein
MSTLLFLRFVHIVASVCWVGGMLTMFLFIEPTAKALAPTGLQFVQHMVVKGRFSIFMVITSTLTVLSGALLLWRDASGGWSNWLRTGPGLGFTLGSLAGVVVYCIGMFGVNPRALRLSKLGAEIQAAGGPPTPAQAAELQELDREMSRLGLIEFVFVAVSLAFMASARFWYF